MAALGGGALLLLIVVLVVAGSGKSHDVSGSFEFSGGYGSCEGTGGYSDIGPSTEATLYDGAGAVLSTTNLGYGQEDSSLGYCEFTFTFDSVPEVDFYQFEVGDRGKLKFSLAEMKANDWSVGGSLG